MELLDAIRASLGANPSADQYALREPGEIELQAFLEARKAPNHTESAASPAPTGITPLISHHQFNRGGLFVDRSTPVAQRALVYLLNFDGLMLSDPGAPIHALWRRGQRERALEEFRLLCKQIAEIESLLSHNIIRVSSEHPKLDEKDRAHVLEHFGVDPEMRVFTNFLEAFAGAQELGSSGAAAYIDQAQELLHLLGVTGLKTPDVRAAHEAVLRVGRGLIHLSWQLAVAAHDPSVDLSLHDPIERQLLDELLSSEPTPPLTAAARGGSRSRHLSRLWQGSLPNLASLDLTVADAIAIRHDDTFESFRDSLHTALARLETTDPARASDATDEFTLEMRQAARRLRSDLPRASFARQAIGTAISTSLSAASLLLPAGSPMQIGSGLAGTTAVSAAARWLLGRRSARANSIAVRYCIELGALN